MLNSIFDCMNEDGVKQITWVDRNNESFVNIDFLPGSAIVTCELLHKSKWNTKTVHSARAWRQNLCSKMKKIT